MTNFDHCDDPRIHPVTPQRASGIVAIHEDCEPPCSRKRAALLYLAERVADGLRGRMTERPEDEHERPAAWLERPDGTWSMVDEYGIPGPPFKVVDGRAVPVDEDG
ncbi:hypothetical protein AB0B25_27485 [Nocardia sp. NPDC049190]|uniref:hypothetical protein n=1 Tax=Nocardia sp. NPDC049190 TaxID=3155650 RepID=UPI0033FF0F5A